MKYSIAIPDIANEIKKFDFAVERMKEVVPELVSDKLLQEALGLKQSSFATCKKRGNISESALIHFCVKYNVNMNWFFADIGEPLLNQESVEVSQVEREQRDMESLIKQAMVNILPQMERANLPLTNESLHKMIKTYLKFKDREGTDISTLLRAVAEIEAEG